jgi:hypothetical protein
MHKQTTESKQKEETGKRPLFFPRAENKEIHNKAMQPIENQSLALLSLCWQGCVSESEKAFRQVLCGHPTLAGHESPKRTAPLNLHESLTHNVRLRLKQGQMGVLRLYPCGRYTVRCRFEPEPIPLGVSSVYADSARTFSRPFACSNEKAPHRGSLTLAHAGDPTPANWIGQILHHRMPDGNSLLRSLSFSRVDSVRRRAYCDGNKPVTPLVRSAHQGGCFFAAILLFAWFVYFAVPPSALNFQPSTSLTNARQPWN